MDEKQSQLVVIEPTQAYDVFTARELAEREAKSKADAERAVREERERAEAEQRRIKAEHDAKAAAEAKAAANKEHQRKINTAIVADLVEHAGLSDEQAKAVVRATVSGKISRLTINYGAEK